MEPLLAPINSTKSGNKPVTSSLNTQTHSDYVPLKDEEEKVFESRSSKQCAQMNISMSSDDNKTSTDQDFDDLEFLHDFLEHEAKMGFFETNYFRINCKNISILCFIIALFAIGFYVLYSNDYMHNYINDNYVILIKRASIPLICIAFTYGHIALALWMTFWPTEFWPHPIFQFQKGPFKGYGFGWQGIVPLKAIKMAQIAVDLMVPDVVRMEDVVAKIEPSAVSKIVEPALYEILKILIPRVAARQSPIGWALLPQVAKDTMIEVAIEDSHISVENMIEDINENIEDMFDLTEFISNSLRNDKELLSRIFLKCGRKELVFIRNFGGAMGLFFGLVQMFCDLYFSGFWFKHLMLPVSGFLLGWITNWIALKLIFRPINPRYFRPFCCFGPRVKLQGLFLQRQREVSVEFSAMLTKQVLTAQNILASMYRGPSSDKLFEKITKHLQEACDRFAGYQKCKPIVEYAIGTERFNAAKQEVIDGLFNCLELKCAPQITEVQRKLEEYTDEAMDVERLLRTKMAALSSEQFEGVLHPVFEQDEIKLIAIGALLGLLVGLFQVYVIGN